VTVRSLPLRIIRRLVREGRLVAIQSRQATIRLIPRRRALAVGAANSLCDYERLVKLQRLANEVAGRRLAGHVVECGVYRGGSAVVLAERLLRHSKERTISLFDVFSGMPQPGPEDPPEAWEDVGKFVSSEAVVRQNFAAAGLPLGRVHIVAGRFEDTLPHWKPFPITFLHLDCDWYESVKLCLKTFYDSVLPGGAVVFDDYGFWSGCRKAVDEFFLERSISTPLIPIDSTSHYFFKGE